MKRIRVAGLVEMGNGYAFMHRRNVKKKENSDAPYGDYYVFPGGGLEDGEVLEEGPEILPEEEKGFIKDYSKYENLTSSIPGTPPRDLYDGW